MLLPIADGGEGTADVICRAAAASGANAMVRDPLGKMVTSALLHDRRRRDAVLEMSEASGLWRVPSERREPSSRVHLAPAKCCSMPAGGESTQIIIGLGGSATNDGGFGMARALGFRFFDENGASLRAMLPISPSRELIGRLNCGCPRSPRRLTFGIHCSASAVPPPASEPQKGATPNRWKCWKPRCRSSLT